MLLLTQMAAGLAVVLAVAAHLDASRATELRLSFCLWAVLHAGLGVSILHLGRPLGAWRFFLGLRTSWMSREILAFAVFGMLTSATLLTALVPIAHDLLPLFGFATAGVGLVGVFTSAMIYVDTKRPSWRAKLTLPRFFGSTVALGLTAAATVSPEVAALSAAAIVARIALHAWETVTHAALVRSTEDPAHRSALIVSGLLPWSLRARTLLMLGSIGASLAVTATAGGAATAFATAALLAGFAAQLVERHAFFVASPAPRMPGGVPV
jgi:DMSO reductase anchor subunit